MYLFSYTKMIFDNYFFISDLIWFWDTAYFSIYTTCWKRVSRMYSLKSSSVNCPHVSVSHKTPAMLLMYYFCNYIHMQNTVLTCSVGIIFFCSHYRISIAPQELPLRVSLYLLIFKLLKLKIVWGNTNRVVNKAVFNWIMIKEWTKPSLPMTTGR
jgi:hypothetical protein